MTRTLCRTIALGLTLIISITLVSPVAAASSANPKGSVKLKNSQIRERTGYFCGRVKGTWLPGRKLSKGFFYPTKAEISNLTASMKVASTRKKAQIKKQIAAIKTTLASRNKVCAAIGKSGTKTALTRVLSTQPQKWSKFISLERNELDTTAREPRIRANSTAVVFNVTNAVGLAQPEDATGSNLLAVDANGNATDALVSGDAVIANFYSTPSGRLYVLFSTKTALVDGGTPCLLAEIDLETGIPYCIDDSLNNVIFTNSYGQFAGPIQLDQRGNIFYQGNLSNGKTVLRKYSGGVITDLINDNISLYSFLVLPDGSVILSGATTSTGASWVRRLSAAGSLSSLVSGSSANFISKFADGNAYFGVWGATAAGVRRFNVSSQSLDPKYWISGSANGVSHSKYFDADALCSTNRSQLEAFCGWYGTYIQSIYNFSESETYVVSGSLGQGGILMQYYPVVEKQESSISRISLSQGASGKIILSGTSSEGYNITTLYDTKTKVETVVADASNEIEMYNITYVESTNKAMFNGLRFADNQFVVGEIALR